MCVEVRVRRRSHVTGIVVLLFLSVLAIEHSSTQEHSFNLQNEVTYATVEDVKLKMDIAYPTDGTGPYPALIYICGNGWGWYSDINRAQYIGQIQSAARRGYVAATIDYRYTSIKENGKARYLFPAQLYDVKCAVRWFRANAAKYNLDPKHIGAIGWSSGGHLALMLGLTNSSDRLEGECGDMQFSSSVQAIVNIAGHTDLASLFMESKTMPGMIAQLLGGTPEQLPSQYFAASPINYISKDDPPVFSIQGTKDQANVPRQSELLDERMREIGLPHTLIIKEGAGHGNFTNENGMWEFLDRVLKATNE